MPEHQPSDRVALSEAQFRAVFELATRAAPTEEGIPLARVREILARGPEQEAAAAAPRPVVRRAVLMGAAACAIGVATALIASAKLDHMVDGVAVRIGSGAFIDVPVALFLMGMTLVNLRSRHRARRMDRFQVENLATWLAFGIGLSVAHGELTDDLVAFVASMTGGFAVLGWLTTRPWRGVFRRNPATADAAAPAASERAEGYRGNVVERRRTFAVAP